MAAAATYLFRDQIFPKSKSPSVPTILSKAGDGSGNPRDFVEKMISGVSFFDTKSSVCSDPPPLFRKSDW